MIQPLCLCGAWLEKHQVFIHLLFQLIWYQLIFTVVCLIFIDYSVQNSPFFWMGSCFLRRLILNNIVRSLYFMNILTSIFLLWIFLVMLASLAIIACRLVCLVTKFYSSCVYIYHLCHAPFSVHLYLSLLPYSYQYARRLAHVSL